MPTTQLDRYLSERGPATPCIVIDLDIVRARYPALREGLPAAQIYYAVKANLAPEIVATLAALGANFDLASSGEIGLCQSLGIAAGRLSFGNTIKRKTAIAKAAADGIDLFAFDSLAELDKLSRSAFGAQLFCRPLIENKGAEWPLTRKFGCEAHMAADLLVGAKERGLRPIGVSFHVGSQQTESSGLGEGYRAGRLGIPHLRRWRGRARGAQSRGRVAGALSRVGAAGSPTMPRQ